MQRSPVSLVVTALVLLIGIAPISAGARGKAAASPVKEQDASKALIEKAQAALTANDAAGATRLLEAAYRTSRRPEVLYHLGRVAASAGRPLAAHDLLRRYLSDPAREPDEAATKSAEQLLAQPLPSKGSISILSEPGALVIVDERVVGTLPLPAPLLVSPESHTIALEFPQKKLESPVLVLPGRTSELRMSRTTGVVLVSIVPALLYHLEAGQLPADAKRALGEALEQAVRGEQHTLMDVDAALLGAQELKECIPKESCRRQLAEKSKLDFLLEQRTELVGKEPESTWKTKLRLLRAAVVEPAATAEVSCEKCTLDTAAARLKEAASRLLAQGLVRTYGRVRITAEPATATLRLGEGAPVAGPFEAALWTGSYDLVVRAPGYQNEKRELKITDGNQSEINVTLSKIEAPAPPPPKLVPPSVLRWETGPRPRWRLALGGVLVGVGVGLGALGGVGIARDGACIETPAVDQAECPELHNTKTAGGVGIGIGAALTIGGGVLLGLPGPRRQVAVIK